MSRIVPLRRPPPPGGWALLAAAVVALPARAQPTTTPARPPIPAGLDLYRPVPPANPLTAAKVDLGRALFFDPILSADSTLSCSSCHDPARAFTDGRPRSVGVGRRLGMRNVPTLLNRAYGRAFFWDGRTRSLEAQVVQPIEDPSEMALPLGEAVARIRDHGEYPADFAAAFGEGPTERTLAYALASYVRTILAGDAPIDRHLAGDSGALSDVERAGLRLFRGRANCVACHVGPNFSDERFHNTGVAWMTGIPADSGRYLATRREEDTGAFKTPTLREIERTAPYMHDGSLATLADVVDFYDGGGHPNTHLDPEIRRLDLTAVEKRALITFLRSLSGSVQEGKLGPGGV